MPFKTHIEIISKENKEGEGFFGEKKG